MRRLRVVSSGDGAIENRTGSKSRQVDVIAPISAEQKPSWWHWGGSRWRAISALHRTVENGTERHRLTVVSLWRRFNVRTTVFSQVGRRPKGAPWLQQLP